MSESDAVEVVPDYIPRHGPRQRPHMLSNSSSGSDDVIVIDQSNHSTHRRPSRRRATRNDSVVDLTCLPNDSGSPDLVDLTTSRDTATVVQSPDLVIVDDFDSTSSVPSLIPKRRKKTTEDSNVPAILRLNCPVCLDPLQSLLKNGSELRSTVCGHVFCRNCITTAIRSNKKCPTCRRKLTERQTHPLYLPIT